MKKFLTKNLKLINRIFLIVILIVLTFLLLLLVVPGFNEVVNVNLIKDLTIVISLTISLTLSLTINISYNITQYSANRDVVLNQNNEISSTTIKDEKKYILKLLFQIKESIVEIMKSLTYFKNAASTNLSEDKDLSMSKGFYMEIFEPFKSMRDNYKELKTNIELINDNMFVASLKDLLAIIEIVEVYILKYFFSNNNKVLIDSIKQSQAAVHYKNVNSFLDKYIAEYKIVVTSIKNEMNI